MAFYFDTMKQDVFTRNVPGVTERLQKVCVGIAGCGGLGSNAAVMLARAGIGKLILADFDRVEPSNLNRQHFFLSDLGKPKAEALAAYLKAINPTIVLDIHTCMVDRDNMVSIFGEADMLLEAFDQAESKLWLIQSWCSRYPSKPLVSGNGLAGYGSWETLRMEQIGNLVLCGDMTSDMALGMTAPRVMIVAAMQANAVIQLILEGKAT